jgi:hypothetical protein
VTSRKPPSRGARAATTRELAALTKQLEQQVAQAQGAPRWNPDPDQVTRSVAKLVLTLVEFVRRLLERQAIRRMENKTLTPQQVEELGAALMKLEETVHSIAKQFELEPEELNLELGPLGRMM